MLGDGRKFVGALVAPVFTRLEAHAKNQGLAYTTREQLVALPEVSAFVQQLVDETTRWVPPHEKIRQIVLLPRELTMADGELSPTLKIRRRVVEQKYEAVIEEMFSRLVGKGQEQEVRSRKSE